MTLEDQVTLLDQFTHTEQDHKKIQNFDFVRENSTAKERVRIEETFCTIVTVGGKYLHRNTLRKVTIKVNEIRKIIRNVLIILFYIDYIHNTIKLRDIPNS